MQLSHIIFRFNLASCYHCLLKYSVYLIQCKVHVLRSQFILKPVCTLLSYLNWERCETFVKTTVIDGCSQKQNACQIKRMAEIECDKFWLLSLMNYLLMMLANIFESRFDRCAVIQMKVNVKYVRLCVWLLSYPTFRQCTIHIFKKNRIVRRLSLRLNTFTWFSRKITLHRAPWLRG